MKVFTGRVVSTKMPKTATVAVENILVHPLYKKRMVRIKKYHVHDEKGVKVGDLVQFTEAKPISKTKRWVISEVIDEEKEKAKSKKKSTKKKAKR
jgi:small subunit ribosomal protein S17